jgi:hypothetical protein
LVSNFHIGIKRLGWPPKGMKEFPRRLHAGYFRMPCFITHSKR